MNLPFLFKLILIVISYFVLGNLGLSLSTVNESVTPIWAPSGIAIISIFLLGLRIWPIIFIAAFVTNFTNNGDLISASGISIGNTLEAIIGGYFMLKILGKKYTFDAPRRIFKFLNIILFASMISATWGVSSLLLANQLAINTLNATWFTWWLGNISGALLIIPFVYFWSQKLDSKLIPRRKLEGVFIILTLVIVSGVVFNGTFINLQQSYPLAFLCIPLLVWIALRFNQKITTASVIILSLIAIWGTINELGTFSIYDKSTSLILLQSFLSVALITSISIAALVKQREGVKGLFQNVLDNMSEGFQIIDFNWRYIYVNDAVVEQGRSKKENLLGKTMMEVYPGIEKSPLFGALEKVMIERVPHNMENEFKFPDASLGWFALKIEPVNEGILILSVDITKQKRDQMRLARDKVEDDALLDSIGDGIIATNEKGIIILVNKAFEEMLGFNKSELLGARTFDKFLMEYENKKILLDQDRPLHKALNTGNKITVTHYLVRKDGTKFMAIITATPIRLNDEIIGAVMVFHDITAEREVDRMKNEFISMASHELRTPLSVVKGFTSMIRNEDYGKLSPKLRRPVEHISISTDRLVKIVNQMLDVSRIDASRVELRFSEFLLGDLIKKTVMVLGSIKDKENVEFEINGNLEGLAVKADLGKSVEILKNLLENAFKFTAMGKVIIRIGKKKNSAVVYIEDTGIGISKIDQKKLFNKFEQIMSKKTGRSGIGLGLYISREVARKMGGDLWIEKSEPGTGSIFALSMRIAVNNSH